MNSSTIIELLDILIGHTEATGSSDVDEIVEKNLKKLIDVTNWCLEGVAQSSNTRHKFEHSMRAIGERAFSAMDEWRTWLECLKDPDDDNTVMQPGF